MPSASKPAAIVFLFFFLLFSGLFFKLLVRPCRACSPRQDSHTEKAPSPTISHYVLRLDDESDRELKAVKKLWQRWAALPPCRFNTEPVGWEENQVALYVAVGNMTSGRSAFKDEVLSAWSELSETPKWCFEDPVLVPYDAVKDLAHLERPKGWVLEANVRLLPLKSNWINQLARDRLESSEDSHTVNLGGGCLLTRSYARGESPGLVVDRPLPLASGSLLRHKRAYPEHHLVIAADRVAFDDY